MDKITTIGVDLAKHVFHVVGCDRHGKVLLRKVLRRGQVRGYFANLPACVVGMEGCAGSHFWARELRGLGHEVRLIPAQHVKAYVKGQTYQDTSLRYSKSRVFCPGSGADGDIPSSRPGASAADSSEAAGITHGAPLQA